MLQFTIQILKAVVTITNKIKWGSVSYGSSVLFLTRNVNGWGFGILYIGNLIVLIYRNRKFDRNPKFLSLSIFQLWEIVTKALSNKTKRKFISKVLHLIFRLRAIGEAAPGAQTQYTNIVCRIADCIMKVFDVKPDVKNVLASLLMQFFDFSKVQRSS